LVADFVLFPSRTEWEKISPSVVGYLEKVRTRRLCEARFALIETRTEALREVYESYLSTHRDQEPYAPSYREVARTEPFRTIIYDTPEEDRVGVSQFVSLMDNFPGIIDSWRTETSMLLLHIYTKGSGSPEGKVWLESDIQMLSRATAIFTCSVCCRLHLYPNVLTQACLQKAPQGDASVERVDPNFTWKEDAHIVREEDAISSVTEIIQVLGEDPTSITWKEMDELDKRVECLRCRRTQSGTGKIFRYVMAWRSAVSVNVLQIHAAC